MVSLVLRRHSFSGGTYIEPGCRFILSKKLDLEHISGGVVTIAPATNGHKVNHIQWQRRDTNKDASCINATGASVDVLSTKLGKMLFEIEKTPKETNTGANSAVLYDTRETVSAPAELVAAQPLGLAAPFEPRPASDEHQRMGLQHLSFASNALGIHVDGNQYPPLLYPEPNCSLPPMSALAPRGAFIGPPSPNHYFQAAPHMSHSIDYSMMSKEQVDEPSGVTSPPWSPPHAVSFGPTYMANAHVANMQPYPIYSYPSTPPSPTDQCNFAGSAMLAGAHPIYFAAHSPGQSLTGSTATKISSLGPTVSQRLEEGAVLRRTGVTKFFDLQKGFGFIVDDHVAEISYRDIFVHYTAILMKSGFRCLHADEAVEYDLVKASNGGYQALNGLLNHESERLASVAKNAGAGRKARTTVGVNSVTPVPTRKFPSASAEVKCLPQPIVVSLPTPTSSRAGSAPPTPSAIADDD
ncbi:hypothetical protein OIV83_005938 [Microbotryomycetes sp. JL201]|nr:hypothetical protein OIV83_005938 [Microbotryomycetes sp. JL201]